MTLEKAYRILKAIKKRYPLAAKRLIDHVKKTAAKQEVCPHCCAKQY